MAGALAGLSSCGSSKSAVTFSSISGEWNIIEINGSAVVPAPGQEFPYIGFDTEKGRVYGTGGCNRFMGTFDLQAAPGTLSLSPLGSTRMMCPDMSGEQNVLAALGQVKKYRTLGAGNVALYGSSKRPVAVLQKRTPATRLSDLDGRWTVREAMGTAVPDGMENPPFVEFNVEEKRVHGHTGCNLINGAFLIREEEATSISFPQLTTTMMACPDMEVEGRVLQALNGVRSFRRLSDERVALFDADGRQVMLLVKE